MCWGEYHFLLLFSTYLISFNIQKRESGKVYEREYQYVIKTINNEYI